MEYLDLLLAILLGSVEFLIEQASTIPSEWVTAASTVVLACLTLKYVKLTHKLVAAQSQPCVLVTTENDSRRISLIQLVIKNVGTGIATDVSFELSRPIPRMAWGLSVDQAENAETMSEGPLFFGVPALAPGDERKIDWGQYGGLFKYLGEEPVRIICRFKDAAGKKLDTVSFIDVKSYEYTSGGSESDGDRIAKHLESIARDINRLKNGQASLTVRDYDKLPQPAKEELKRVREVKKIANEVSSTHLQSRIQNIGEPS